jgi:hypothetical protein
VNVVVLPVDLTATVGGIELVARVELGPESPRKSVTIKSWQFIR